MAGAWLMGFTDIGTTTRGPRSFPWSLLVVAVLLAASASCVAEPRSSMGELKPVVTLRDLMNALIGPAADTLWASVTMVETADGIEEKGPETDAEWEKLRRSAVTMVEAANLLLIEGRTVATPGVGPRTPGVQLSPDQIAALLLEEVATWTRLVQEFQQSSQRFLDAIDAKDPTPLLGAGDDLNTACANCHQLFWYPADVNQR